ncbi:MAG: AAA family ATPase [Bacteroidetes bacterium RIFOXYA12_FULL_35_11]|nr:MAG: AAA family ATPase [Bacteroidetes bacterium GWF2_35_48]OFY82183.1 MAG: AAA family ATPase [Bacteroidetes bacterium RIFOXYA12_FULL_35_11]OFY97679.1 MAG: AAA family ATPase [Bacteroidetes bacterium RIFOXYB2_FULL_35_7]HBX50473.1 AAA family ATPase [Bacteroidales bacterium]
MENLNILEQYNYWNKKPIDGGFSRVLYLNRLMKYTGNRLIKVLIGQRRSGKSYVLRQLITKLISQKVNPRNIFYLNKESVDFDYIENYKQLKKLIDLYLLKIKPRGKVYILLDEIQEVSGWEKLVNSLSQDHTKNFEVFITGSNSKMLSGELATLLSGRYVAFEIFPFSYSEFVGYKNLPKEKKTYLEYLNTGGLPELMNLEHEEARLHYVNSLVSTILYKDVVTRYSVKDAYLLERLFKYAAANVGFLVSLNNIVNFLKTQKINVKYETVANYLGYLEDACLLHRAERMEIKTKELLAGNRKYYLNDMAYKNYLISSFDKGFGQLLENSIYLHYRATGYNVNVGMLRNAEIDFCVHKSNDFKYVQVSYLLSDHKVIEREFGNFRQIKDNYEKTVVTMDDLSLGNKEGIKHLLAWEL